MGATTGVIDRLQGAADLVLSVGGALLFLAAAVVLALAVSRAWKRSRQTEVIIETLDDGTGDAAAGGAVLGLTYRLREELVNALPELADRVRKAVTRAASDPTSPLRELNLDDIGRRDALLGDITSSQNDLMASMESMVPQPARGAYRIVANWLLRPKEVRVLGVLQRLNDEVGGVGLSFNVNHVGAEEGASRITLWEDEDGAVGTKTVVERFHALIRPAARALACELLAQRLRMTVAAEGHKGRHAQGMEARPVDGESVVALLVGGSYDTAANQSAPATKSFYEQAERALKKSAKCIDHYKLSYQLGHTLAELARRQGADRDKAIDLLSQSTGRFEEANRKLTGAGLQEAQRKAEELGVQAALTMNACLLAELLPDDEAKAKSAAALACALTTIDPAQYDTDRVVYNIACALALAARVEALGRHGADKERCLERSKLWLLYAGARNDVWWKMGKSDPDLCLLRDWMPDARRRLWEATLAAETDRPPDVEALAARIQEVLDAIGQSVAPRPKTGASTHGRRPRTPTRA